MLDENDIKRLMEGRSRPPRRTAKEILVDRAKESYPYPPNPFCSSYISVQLVDEALQEAGYMDYQLYVREDGIFIEPKER